MEPGESFLPGAIAGGKVLSVPELSKGKVRQAGPGSGSG